MWEIPWRVVRPIGYCAVHSVCTSLFLGVITTLRANTSRALANQHDGSLRVYSTGDLPDVYEDSFMAIANPSGEQFHPTLILVCTRLGIDRINQVYEEALISTLQMEQSIGIAG